MNTYVKEITVKVLMEINITKIVNTYSLEHTFYSRLSKNTSNDHKNNYTSFKH